MEKKFISKDKLQEALQLYHNKVMSLLEVNQKPFKARYIKNAINGNTTNNWGTWVEIEAYDDKGKLVSAGKPVSYSKSIEAKTSKSTDELALTNGNKHFNDYVAVGQEPCWIELDLGAEYEISKVIIWHYWADGRKYHDNVVTLYNEDRSKERIVFDSNMEGEYVETTEGKEFLVSDNEYKTKKDLSNAMQVIVTDEVRNYFISRDIKYGYFIFKPTIPADLEYVRGLNIILPENPQKDCVYIIEQGVYFLERQVTVSTIDGSKISFHSRERDSEIGVSEEKETTSLILVCTSGSFFTWDGNSWYLNKE